MSLSSRRTRSSQPSALSSVVSNATALGDGRSALGSVERPSGLSIAAARNDNGLDGLGINRTDAGRMKGLLLSGIFGDVPDKSHNSGRGL